MNKADAFEQLRGQVKTAREAAAANPLWLEDAEDLEARAINHELGKTTSGWKNPYPAGDPRSLLLEYQFVPFHDDSRFKFQLQGRQTGKDFTAEGEAVTDCMSRKTEWMIGAPSERQALDSLDQAKLWAEAYELHIEGYEEKREGSTSETLLKSAEITYSNGSRQRAVPGKPNTVRGRSANVLLTEFDFFEDPAATWKAILPSITNPLRGGEKMVRLVTTPNGKGGAGHKIWTKEDGKRMAWSKHLITLYHAVLMGLPVDPVVIREAMDDDDAFAQECLCRFLDGSNVLLPYDLIALAESFDATEVWSLDDARYSGNVFLGIDFGRTNDPTVCWTLQKVGDILWTREVLVLQSVSSPDQEQILRDRIAGANKVCFDYTGPGIGLGDYLAKTHGEWKPEGHSFGKVELCTFTSKFKRSIFPNLRRAFEAPTKLRIPVSTVIREDLHEMQQIISNGEYNYWSPRTKNGHSDRCTALALAVRACGGASAPVEYEPIPMGRGGRRYAG
ncbi:MAG: terminase large subunit domain-containing protein [Verrucomicrobiales bacterium]